MLTEYKLKLEKDGLTITQRLEPTSSPAPAFSASNTLKPSFTETKTTNVAKPLAAGASFDPPPGGGVMSSASAPVIIGPIILMCCLCSHSHIEKTEEKE